MPAKGGRLLCDHYPRLDWLAAVSVLLLVWVSFINHLPLKLVSELESRREEMSGIIKKAKIAECRYDLLLKIEYAGRTTYDCQGTAPVEPANNPICTVVPPGGLAGKLHLLVIPFLGLLREAPGAHDDAHSNSRLVFSPGRLDRSHSLYCAVLMSEHAG